MIVKAVFEDIEVLTEIALTSKAYWNYTPEQIESWREDLTITPERFEKWEIFKYKDQDKIAGFHILNFSEDVGHCDLEFLFILPEYIGKGIGKKLLLHAFQTAKENRETCMRVLSDPNAESFYAKYGFEVISKEESSVPGRFLPIMEKELGD